MSNSKISDAARTLGRRGGKAGRGASQRRTPEQYRLIQAAALRTRRVTAAVNALVRAHAAEYEDVRRSIVARWGEGVVLAAEADNL